MATSKATTRSHRHAAWVVAVDMGYGHQRAAQPLGGFARGGIITANTYKGIPSADRTIWNESRRFYEFVSRFKKIPIIGERVYELYDKLQSIPKFYPRRDLSKPNIQVRAIYKLFRRKQWGMHLIDQLGKNPLPLVTTFFVPAFMAEFFGYPGDIYCVATDTDISRAWVAEKPSQSRIIYLAPNYRVAERLREYGVLAERIIVTGFPLPDENTGGKSLTTAKADIAQRLANLDPEKKYRENYTQLIKTQLGRARIPAKSNHPLTLMFAVGGAGAQEGIGVTIVKSVAPLILQKKLRLILVAGVHNAVGETFRTAAVAAGLQDEIGRGIEIIFAPTKDEYFKKFNHALRTTDVLWTKPSELSFYAGLGIPIVMSPPIGSQEFFNQHWLTTIGAGVTQEDPRYAHEWLMDWVKSGWLAEAAMQGFVEAPKLGTYNIEQVVFHQPEKMRKPDTILQF